MPYVKCGRCGVKTFSAAYWSNVDHCAGCGVEFPRERRGVASIARYGSPVTPPSSSQQLGREHFSEIDEQP